MTVLLLAEVHNGHLNDSTAKALTAAAQLGGPVHILVAGQGSGNSDEAAQAASKLAGVDKVLTANGRSLRPWPRRAARRPDRGFGAVL